MPALLVAVALLGLALGVISPELPSLLAVVLAVVLVASLGLLRLGRQSRCSLTTLGCRGALLALVLMLTIVWGALHRPQPGPEDPVRRLEPPSASRQVELQGTLLRDAPSPLPAEGCSLPLQTAGGRVQLRLHPCQALQEGWVVAVSGDLSVPPTGPHPLLAGPAQRLARDGLWSQLRVRQLQVVRRPPTPIADLRRRMAAALIGLGGADLGGLWAALVLGSAVVPVPAAVRESFRVAGLSHALAASGFHLTVLLGAVRAVARPLPAPLRWTAAGGAMGVVLLLAGPQPSVVRAVVMAAVAFA
ncbi:MAG: ComEC/Rec2 family competence protein, partial [Cyanobacteriota bacterium]